MLRWNASCRPHMLPVLLNVYQLQQNTTCQPQHPHYAMAPHGAARQGTAWHGKSHGIKRVNQRRVRWASNVTLRKPQKTLKTLTNYTDKKNWQKTERENIKDQKINKWNRQKHRQRVYIQKEIHKRYKKEKKSMENEDEKANIKKSKYIKNCTHTNKQ